MAVAPQISAFDIIDLRLLRARALNPLFEEQQQLWLEQLHWDYRPSVEMIRRNIDSHSLSGYVALMHQKVVGYCFFVYEEHKGLVGDLYVLRAFQAQRPYGTAADIATLLLERALRTLEQTPMVRRIETQLIPLGGEPLDSVFRSFGLQPFPRLFMFKQLSGRPTVDRPQPRAGIPPTRSRPARESWELRRWDDRDFEDMAGLIVDAYKGHLDSQINNQYAHSDGAMRFLKNIVVFPGCGVFQRETSLVAVEPSSLSMIGAALTSRVAPRVAHITQICVRRSWQGRGLGRQLMQETLGLLAAKGYEGVSLTVTAENHSAVHLYRDLDFHVIKEFTAYARNLPRPHA